MRILFSSSPAFGHLLPMMPLAGAARRAGHEAAVLTGAAMADAVGDLPVLPAGPAMDVLLAETARRTGAGDPADMDTSDPSTIAQFFGGARVDLGFEDALAAAGTFGPDLVVCEAVDFVGPMVAAALGVPWASHGVTISIPEALIRAVGETAAARYAERGIAPTARAAFVDPWPDVMQPEGWVVPRDRIAVRPQAYAPEGGAEGGDGGDPDGAPRRGASFPGREDRPLVLVTLGTVAGDREALDAILASLAPPGVNAVVTAGALGAPEALVVDRARVRPVGFVPLGRLLEGVDLVVAAGGARTVLGALSRSLPMVLVPMVAEQPLIAERVGSLGAAAVADGPERAGEAVSAVLADPSYREAAGEVAAGMEEMNPPGEALRLLLERAVG